MISSVVVIPQRVEVRLRLQDIRHDLLAAVGRKVRGLPCDERDAGIILERGREAGAALLRELEIVEAGDLDDLALLQPLTDVVPGRDALCRNYRRRSTSGMRAASRRCGRG